MKPGGDALHRLEAEGGYRFVVNERLGGFRDWLAGRDHRRFGLLMLVILVLGTTLVISSKYLPSRYDFRVGDVASTSIVADRTLSYEDKASTEALRSQVAALVEPVHRAEPQAFAETVAAVGALLDQVESARGQAGGGQPGATSTSPAAGEALTLLRERAPAAVSDASLSYLLTASPEVIAQLRREIPRALAIAYAGALTDTSLDAGRAKLRGMADGMNGPEQFRDAAYQLMSAYLRPNQVVDEPQTQARRQQAMSEVAPVIVTIYKGQEVVKAGDKITEQTMSTLEALGVVDARPSWEIWLGTFIVVILESIVVVGLVHRIQPALLRDNLILLAMTTLILFFTVLARLLVIPPLSGYLVPLAALAMLTTILTRPRTALLLVSMLAINIGLMAGFDFNVIVVMLISSVFSLYSVSRLAQRSDLLLAGVLVALVAGAAVFAGELLAEAPIGSAFRASLWGIGNGVLSLVLTVSLLMVYESVFNLTTPLRLLELANPSRPLLRQLSQVAPGTYNHSILMGNLAEAAAEAIDADPLLARVGAYYHDIGKIVRPEYFVENQLHVPNPHERMTPNLSKLAIRAHVRDGEALARAYGLPQPIIDIIRQHHGTSVLAFFYDKAKRDSRGEVVAEEEFRYEGEKPDSPESAIIMLADSVEAAAKAMKNPTVKKMQDLIRDIFKQKMDDGQLDDAQVTLGDMHKIRDVFEAGLRGLAGHRIPYPKESGRTEPSREHRLPRAAAAGGDGPPARASRASKAGLRSVAGALSDGGASADGAAPPAGTAVEAPDATPVSARSDGVSETDGGGEDPGGNGAASPRV